MFNTRNNRWGLPPVVQSLLIANILMWLIVAIALKTRNPQLMGMIDSLALFPLGSGLFRPWQPFTYMFMHGGWVHLAFNMFTLWMFGRFIEYDLRSRRFLIYYLVCGVGAGLIQLLVVHLFPPSDGLAVTMGASGAVYGLLLAFAMLHPNEIIMPLFPPIPMRAKWAVLIFAGIELTLGVMNARSINPIDNVAHFAHLGGALFGFVLLWWWLKRRKIYKYS
jgi:membrane associated rhomboid family serine protease